MYNVYNRTSLYAKSKRTHSKKNSTYPWIWIPLAARQIETARAARQFRNDHLAHHRIVVIAARCIRHTSTIIILAGRRICRGRRRRAGHAGRRRLDEQQRRFGHFDVRNTHAQEKHTENARFANETLFPM